jgi:hypothetical protein
MSSLEWFAAYVNGIVVIVLHEQRRVVRSEKQILDEWSATRK